jgi:hypothetical protein
MAGRGQLHLVLSAVQWQEVVEPADFEEAVREAGFGVGDSIEKGPIDGMELGDRPVVDSAKVLDL